jgi:membrane protease YdiL (CAAX protease family)
MWKWACDQRIVEKFKKLNLLEMLFFIFFVFMYSIAFSFPDRVLIILWTLIIFRVDVVFTAFNFSKVSLKIFQQIDKKIYFLFVASCLISLSMTLFFPGSWKGIESSIKIMSSKIVFFDKLLFIFKEEFLYRFLLYYSINRFFGRNFAFFSTIAFFSLMHHGNSFYYPFAVIPAGFLFSIFVIATGSIWASFLLHLIFNIIVYIFATNFL